MSRRLLYLLPVLVFAVLLVFFALGLTRDPSLLPSALIDRPAPAFALPGLDGAPDALSAADLSGGAAHIVNFFASWCAPCRSEHPQLLALSRDTGAALDGIAYKDKPEDSRRFLDLLGNPYHRVGVDRQGSTAIDFGVYGVPETYVLDRNGRIRYRHVGPLSAEDLQDKLLPLLRMLDRS